MIATLTRSIAAYLLARGYPYSVDYGPDRLASIMIGEPGVTIERERRARIDVVHAPKTHALNPPIRAQRTLACVARIYARDTRAGATLEEHERHADKAVDMLIVALQKAVAAIHTTATLGAGGYVDATSLGLDGLESWPGVVYEQAFTVERGVRDSTWADGIRDESTDNIHTTAGTCVTSAAPD